MAMMQTGVATSKVLILVGAGLTGSIVLRSGPLSDIISQLQELMKRANETEVAPENYDSSLLAAQIRHLAQEIRELTVARPITIYNGESSSNGGISSYLVPAAAIGAMGYCYMWWKGWSLSDVMFVTKHNMANAVATVSKQLDQVSDTIASTKRHLSKKLEKLDWKFEEQKETSLLIANDVSEVRTNLNQIGFDIDSIHRMVSGLEGKLELLESKQDMTNSGLWYLCQVADGINDGKNAKPLMGVEKIAKNSQLALEQNSLKGLQFLTESNEPSDVNELMTKTKQIDISNNPIKGIAVTKTRIHRSYTVGISSSRGLFAPDL